VCVSTFRNCNWFILKNQKNWWWQETTNSLEYSKFLCQWPIGKYNIPLKKITTHLHQLIMKAERKYWHVKSPSRFTKKFQSCWFFCECYCGLVSAAAMFEPREERETKHLPHHITLLLALTASLLKLKTHKHFKNCVLQSLCHIFAQLICIYKNKRAK
jgi:hypothetical protein